MIEKMTPSSLIELLMALWTGDQPVESGLKNQLLVVTELKKDSRILKFIHRAVFEATFKAAFETNLVGLWIGY